MSALNSLVRVHGWVLDEKRQKLAAIEDLAGKMRADLEALEQDMKREQRAAAEASEGGVAFPAFVAAALERRRKLRESIADLERAVEAAREEVAEAFREAKKYELARDNDVRREEGRRSKREQAELDELGTNLHRRRGATGEDPAS